MRRVILTIVSLIMIIGCGGPQSAVQKMLAKAKKGEDAGEYWVGGVTRQKLYNVIDYEVMSDRPLSDSMKQYLPKAKKYQETLIKASEKAIADINERSEKYRAALPVLNMMAVIDVPYHVENDTYGNFNRMIEVLKSYRQQFPNDSDVNAPITHINQAAEWLQKAQNYSRERRSASLVEQVSGYATESVERSYSSFREVVRKNRELRDTAMEAVNSAPKKIEEEMAIIGKAKLAISELEALVNGSDGVAYKAKVNSTNKAGQPIVWIWTVTVVRPEKAWRVSYLYNEEEFAEEKSPQEMYEALLSILGK